MSERNDQEFAQGGFVPNSAPEGSIPVWLTPDPCTMPMKVIEHYKVDVTKPLDTAKIVKFIRDNR